MRAALGPLPAGAVRVLLLHRSLRAESWGIQKLVTWSTERNSLSLLSWVWWAVHGPPVSCALLALGAVVTSWQDPQSWSSLSG